MKFFWLSLLISLPSLAQTQIGQIEFLQKAEASESFRKYTQGMSFARIESGFISDQNSNGDEILCEYTSKYTATILKEQDNRVYLYKTLPIKKLITQNEKCQSLLEIFNDPTQLGYDEVAHVSLENKLSFNEILNQQDIRIGQMSENLFEIKFDYLNEEGGQDKVALELNLSLPALLNPVKFSINGVESAGPVQLPDVNVKDLKLNNIPLCDVEAEECQAPADLTILIQNEI